MTQAPVRHLGHSVLVVAVPALEEWVRRRTRHYDSAYLSDDPTFAHAHITVVGPFVPLDLADADVCERVGDVLGRHPVVEAELSELATFPDGTIHLRVRPDEPFRRLTADVWTAFPEYPPYGGRFGPVKPHLTLDRVGADVDEEAVRGWIADLLPARVQVGEVLLSWYEQEACRTLARWPLAAR